MSLPPTIERTPMLDRWISVNEDGTITVNTGKAEIGQGIGTAIAMIAAEELDVRVDRINVQTADTAITPNEFMTAGSMSIEDSGGAIRIAAATARQLLLALAAELLGVGSKTLTIEDGLISSTDSNEQTDFWFLQGGHPFGVKILDTPPLKNPHSYQTVGRKSVRIDLAAKVRGDVAFLHDMTLPKMRHGRLVKPPTPGAMLLDCPLEPGMAGVEIVRDGSFLGIIAEREEQALIAAEQLAARCRWQTELLSPLPGEVPDQLRNQVQRSLPVVGGTPLDEPVEYPLPLEDSCSTFSATYYRPFQMHASMGPSVALAQFMNGMLTVYSHSQGVEVLKVALATVLKLAADQVRVIHAEGAGCYGHNGADDVALDAALLAIAAEPTPIKVSWTRSQEHGFEPYGPAALIDMRADLDDAGQITDWHHETHSYSHAGRPRPSARTPDQVPQSNLQSSWWRDPACEPIPRRPALFAEVGIHRNLQPIYTFPKTHLVKHFVANSPLRTSSLRSLGAFANVFAIESFMDELAHSANVEPVEFRLAHLEDERARTVLKVLHDKAGSPPTQSGYGRGMALARYKNRQTYCAVLVDLEVSEDACVRLLRALIVADAGLVIDPDGLINQLEGGFIQSASWALKEEVMWDENGVVSRDWADYPILKFSEVPAIETFLVDRPLEKAMGAGEASTGPTPAAIANAIFSASGIRVRNIPFTQTQLRQAAASVSEP